MSSIKVFLKDEGLRYETEISIPVNLPPYTIDCIKVWLKDNAEKSVFEYDYYHNCTFGLVTDTLIFNGTAMKLKCSYCLDRYNMEYFVPEEATIIGDSLEYLTFVLV